jgi:tRNA pseudouridine13 synthase
VPTTDQTNRPILKFLPRDFVVVENLTPPYAEVTGPDVSASDGADEFTYLRVRKLGLTTFEAVRAIGETWQIAPQEVGYAGLKDEDGVTEQLVSVPSKRVGSLALVEESVRGADRWLAIQIAGTGPRPIRVGWLNGNGFRIVVRRLDRVLATTLADRGTWRHLFANYYDTQRFGVPGGPRHTHLIGRAVLAGDWDRARVLLREAQTPESRFATSVAGSAEEMFARLDPRVVAFYQSAAASADWNGDLLDRLVAASDGQLHQDVTDGIDFTFVTSQPALARLLVGCPELPYRKHRWAGDGFQASWSVRTTVLQTFIRVDDAGPDPFHDGYWQATLSFFLPAGSYATMAVRQLLARDDTAA